MTVWYGFRNRDLIPSEGRWAERDPLRLAAGDVDIYRYVGNTPTQTVDPSGLEWPPMDAHLYPLELGGHPHGPTFPKLPGINHQDFHAYLRERGFTGKAGRDAWEALSKCRQKRYLIGAARAAKIPEDWIKKNIAKSMRMATPGFNYSPFSRASSAKLAKLGGTALGVAMLILDNPSPADAAYLNIDWRDPHFLAKFGDRTEKCEVAKFKSIVMVPTAINVFGDTEFVGGNQTGPWEDLGPTTATEAMLMEGMVGSKVLYWNQAFTVYELTYLRSRWAGVGSGLPPY